MSQKCSKKLVLLKTLYFRALTQENEENANRTFFNTNPSTPTFSDIRRMTDKNYNPIENEFILFNKITIPANNSISEIDKQIFQHNILIKTKCGFVSANTFFFDKGSSDHIHTTVLFNIFPVTAASGDLKNAVKLTIEYDNKGTIFSNGVIFARRIKVYGYK